MSQNIAFDIKITDGQTVQFSQEETFENFIAQFQSMCPKLLCVVDGTSLRYYDNYGSLPKNIRFDYKQRRGKLTEYYFRDIGNDTLYCVFGREACKIFYPRIDEVDPSGLNESIATTVNIDRNLKSTQDKPSESNSRISPDDSLSNICKPKRKTIIQPILQSVSNKQSNNIRHDITTQSVPNSNIVIIDKGVRLTFPNPNFTIEIKTYYP